MPLYLRYLFVVGAGVASILGLVIAASVDARWLLVFYVVTFFLASAGVCYTNHFETKRAKDEAEDERRKREEIEQQLKRLPLQGFQLLFEAIAQWNLHETASRLAEGAGFLGRMSLLGEVGDTAFDVRTVEAHGSTLYVIAKVSEETKKLLRVGDQFYLTNATASNVDHPIAILAVDPHFRPKDRSVGLRVVRAVDEEFYDRLKGITQATDKLKGLASLKVRTIVDAKDLDGVDMQNAEKAILLLEPLLKKLVAGDESDGN